MVYTIRHFDTPVLKFSADDGAESNIQVLWKTDKTDLLPLDLVEATGTGVESWIRHRSIPKSRAYVASLLSKMGLSINRPMDIVRVSKGLSLNDCYWVTEEGFNGSFKDCNLYDQRFSRVLALIALTGYGSSNISGIRSSPEFTTNGMLPKCWRRESGIIRLYKGGTEGVSNSGNEPYSEFYAYEIAKALGVNAIPYSLSVWKEKLCSVCDLFTSKELSFVPIGRIVRSGGMKAIREFYSSHGSAFVEALDDMIVFDAVTFNTDRHYGNFGVLLDSKTNKIVAPAPLFDHGDALFSLAGMVDLSDKASLEKYAKTLRPYGYDDFVEEAKPLLTHERRNNLRKLLNFHFTRHCKYNLLPERLALIEHVVQKQVQTLLAED